MKIALFVDFDNVYSGLRRISAEAAERFSRHPLRWLHWLTTGADGASVGETPLVHRRVLVRRCYLNPVMYQKYRRPFHEAGFEIVDCPPMTATGKTSTDIHLVLDTMDALLDGTHFDEFIIFSADADFSPMLRRLRRHDRRTVVFAAGAMSESYKASADRVIDIQTFLRDALQLASVEDEEDLPVQAEGALDVNPTNHLRKRVADRVRSMVLQAEQPVALPALAQFLHREIAGLREGRWDGTGSFGNLMRELDVDEVDFDFLNDIAIDRQRRNNSQASKTEEASRQPPPAVPASSDEDDARGVAKSESLAPEALRLAAEKVVRHAVAKSKGPLHLSMLAQLLRQGVPQLANGWADAPNLGAFLQQLHLEPLQRAVLENGSTVVLYDPVRHEAPAGLVGDRLVVSMLRAAELPEMRGPDLVRILATARSHMGDAESFEIAEVSRNVAAEMTEQGRPISPRRVATVLQAMIFGGLDPTKPYQDEQDVVAVSMGVILSAWARESQATPDDDARSRLLAWLGPMSAS